MEARGFWFSEPEVVDLLSREFIPIVLDSWPFYREFMAGTQEGEFWHKAFGPLLEKYDSGLKQSHFCFTAGGDLIGGATRLYAGGHGDLKPYLKAALKEFQRGKKAGDPGARAVEIKQDPGVVGAYDQGLLEGGIVIRVTNKFVEQAGGWTSVFPKPHDEYRRKAEEAYRGVGHDRLWVRKDEAEQLAGGIFPESLKTRIARFHLYPTYYGLIGPDWEKDGKRNVDVTLSQGQIRGKVEIKADEGKRGYTPDLVGRVEAEGGKVTRFDLVARGWYWENARWEGKPTNGMRLLAVGFTLASEDDPSRVVPPATFYRGIRPAEYLR